MGVPQQKHLSSLNFQRLSKGQVLKWAQMPYFPEVHRYYFFPSCW